MEINTGRNLQSFPHCGRVFVCSDVLGITDIRTAVDAYQFALENGIPFVNSVASGVNWGNMYSLGVQLGTLAQQAVTGVTHGFQCLVSSPYYSTEAMGELRPDCDGYSLDLCFRFLTQSQYQAFTNYANISDGRGYRSQRITVTIQNQAVAANSSTYVLVDIFADYNYYSANVATLPAITSAVNTIDLATNPRGFAVGGIFNGTFIGTLPATMLRNAVCQANCFFRYEMPLAPNGNAWSAPPAPVNSFGNMFTTASFGPAENPLTGTYGESGNSAAGIISTSLHTFFTGLGTAPTGASGGTGGARTVTTFLNQTVSPIPAMGSNLNAAHFSTLLLRARASIRASWPSISIMSRNFGGVLKPICGHGGTYTETDAATHTMTTYIQVPQGATNYVLIAKVRTITAAGTHTIDFLLTSSDNTQQQTLASTTQATFATNYRYLYVNGTLSLPMRPVSGLVERYELRLRSTKSAPRSIQINEPYLADGIIAMYICFYQ